MADKKGKEPKEEEKPTGIVKHFKVVNTVEIDNLVLKEFEGASACKGASVISGFPEVGVTSVLAVHYITDQLNLPLIGVVSSRDLPPTSVVRNSQPAHAIRVFGDKHIVAFLSEVKVPDNVMPALINCILDFGRRYEVPMIYTIEGVPVEKLDKLMHAEKVQFLTTKEEFAKSLVEFGAKPLGDSVIAGTSGGILAEVVLSDLDVTTLLVPASSFFPDARSAATLVRVLDQLNPEWGVDIGPLEEKAEALESKVKKIMHDHSLRGSKDKETFTTMYG